MRRPQRPGRLRRRRPLPLPEAGIPLSTVATLVASSRVHTGVHYPADVVAGSVIGVALSPLAVTALKRRRAKLAR